MVTEGQEVWMYDGISGCYVQKDMWNKLDTLSRIHRMKNYLTSFVAKDVLDEIFTTIIKKRLDNCSYDQTRIRNMFNSETRITKVVLKALKTTFMSDIKLKLKAYPKLADALPDDGSVAEKDIEFMISMIAFKYVAPGKPHTIDNTIHTHICSTL